MAKQQRRVLVGVGVEDVLDGYFKEIATAIPETLDLIERYTMRIARQQGAERVVLVDEFRKRLLELIRTGFTVVLSDEERLGRIA